MKVSEVITMLRRMLQDVSNVSQRWSDDSLLVWLVEGCQSIVLAKPDVGTRIVSHQINKDSARQNLPDDAVAFIRLISNVATGQAITRSTIADYDACSPGWRNAPAKDNVKQYVFDELDDEYFLGLSTY